MCQSVTINGSYTGQVQQMADMLGIHPRELIWLDGEPREFTPLRLVTRCNIPLLVAPRGHTTLLGATLRNATIFIWQFTAALHDVSCTPLRIAAQRTVLFGNLTSRLCTSLRNVTSRGAVFLIAMQRLNQEP